MDSKNKVVLFIVFMFLSVGAAGNEQQDRDKIRQQAADLFYSEKYSALGDLSGEYLEDSERTSSGLWKLTFFYDGLSQLPDRRNTNEMYWVKLENAALAWVEQQPDSPSGYLVYADFLLDRASMYYRSRESNPENVKKYYVYVAKAREYLLKNKLVSSEDPRWYELMLLIANKESWKIDEFNELLNEGLDKSPYFYQTYFAAAVYLFPRWHGSHSDVEQLALAAVERTGEEESNGMYARIYWYAAQMNYGIRLFSDSDVQWDKMSISIDDVIERYPDQWNINNFAYYACLAGDAEKTSALIALIEGDGLKRVWGDGNYLLRCKTWSGGHTTKEYWLEELKLYVESFIYKLSTFIVTLIKSLIDLISQK